MTTIDVVTKILNNNGLKVKTGGENCLMVLTPLLAMDSAKSIFDKYIEPFACKQELKMLKNRWKKSYHDFNMMYFKGLNEDETDYVIDLMDTYEDYVKSLIQVFQLQSLQAFNQLKDKNVQSVLAAVNIVSVLCRIANLNFRYTFKDLKEIANNKALNGCEKSMMDFESKLYATQTKESINLNESEELVKCVKGLCNKQILFLKTYKNY